MPRVKTSVSLEPSIWESVRQSAFRLNVDKSDVVEQALREFLERQRGGCEGNVNVKSVEGVSEGNQSTTQQKNLSSTSVPNYDDPARQSLHLTLDRIIDSGHHSVVFATGTILRGVERLTTTEVTDNVASDSVAEFEIGSESIYEDHESKDKSLPEKPRGRRKNAS